MLDGVMTRLLLLVLAAVAAFCLSFGSIMLLRPWLARYAVARPNARSSHRHPTPQGAGIGVVAATLATSWGALPLLPTHTNNEISILLSLTAAMLLLGTLGAIDDVRSLPAGLRLFVQAIALAALIAALPQDMRLLTDLPWWLERSGLFLAGLWFVNLVNFMDGIDWMTVAEFIPLTTALSLMGLAGVLDAFSAFTAAALLGAIGGFAPLNKPIAKLFLGDVGSLPAGLLLGWLLLQLVGSGHLTAALILPLYYLADATLTLGRRVINREPVWQAHREHFYQRALDNGFSVPEVIARVFAVNIALAVLATVSIFAAKLGVPLLLLAAVLVGWLLQRFTRPR